MSVNGTDIDHSERITLHDNNAYAVLGVNDQINIAAGSYLQAKFAVTDTDLWLDGAVATSFAPASQPIALTITRSRQ